jgi:hypothetical protein
MSYFKITVARCTSYPSLAVNREKRKWPWLGTSALLAQGGLVCPPMRSPTLFGVVDGPRDVTFVHAACARLFSLQNTIAAVSSVG